VLAWRNVPLERCVGLRQGEAAHVVPQCRVGGLHGDVPGPALDFDPVGFCELVCPLYLEVVHEWFCGLCWSVMRVAVPRASVEVPVCRIAIGELTATETEGDVIAAAVEVDHLVALRTVLEVLSTHQSLNVPVDC
jgi:hypothetical protein